MEKFKKHNLFGALFVSPNPARRECQQTIGSHSAQFALAWTNKNHDEFHVEPCHFQCFLQYAAGDGFIKFLMDTILM